MKYMRICLSICTLCVLCMVAGCTSTVGHVTPNTQFVYPNSNVTILGPTSASRTKIKWFGSPEFTPAEIRKVHADAIAKVSGANTILNEKSDTKTSVGTFIPRIKMTYTIQGDAASQVVGKQELNAK